MDKCKEDDCERPIAVKKSSRCKVCYQQNLDLMRFYGITLEDYKAMLVKQEHKCHLCKASPLEGSSRAPKLFVDHNHTTGKVRALLCHRCNTGIGYFREDIELMKRAIEYLTANS